LGLIKKRAASKESEAWPRSFGVYDAAWA